MNAMNAKSALDVFYLEARSKILDLAAILDRIDRGGGVGSDARMSLIRRATEVLLTDGDDRAERIQTVFSLPYDPTWERPKPRF